MKNSELKFSEYMQNISRSKSFGKFVLMVYSQINATQNCNVNSRKYPTLPNQSKLTQISDFVSQKEPIAGFYYKDFDSFRNYRLDSSKSTRNVRTVALLQ